MRPYRPPVMRPPHRFRIYPESKNGLYVRVNVWADRRDMLRFSEEVDPKGHHVHGTAYGIKYKPGNSRPLFAEINLYRKRMGMDVLTHEFFHATIAWGRRVGFIWNRFGG